MDVHFKNMLYANSLNYKMSLDRIIDKYSKLQYQDGGIDVDLNNTNSQALEHYVNQSKAELNKLESKSLTDLRDETLRAQDTSRDSQLDLTHQNSEADDTCASNVSSAQLDGGMARSDMSELTVSSLDESQPEDQDEELEMSLRSNGSSWVELYPSMISRIERAWHRQHVSEAADSVLRRYRRWRQQPNRSINNTFIVTRRHGNPREQTGRTLLEKSSNSPVKMQFMGSEATPWSPLQMSTNSQDWRAQQPSPGRVKREQHQPILVMDLSASSETSKPKETSLNKTFNMSQLEEQPSIYAVSPSRLSYSTSKTSLDLSLRSKRHSLAAHSVQTDGCSMYTSQSTSFKERPDIYGSPVRQSPLKARMFNGLSRSPQAFPRSPTGHSVEGFSREPVRRRSMSTSLSSPPQKSLRMFYPQVSHHSFRPQLPSSQSATTTDVMTGRHRLRRHLSFDSSSLPSSRVFYPPKKLDEDFRKLYHKFVCQNKSPFFKGPPCRICATSSEASRGHSSSGLAALALSPHRSLLRKRHRELSWDSHHQSKRSRDEFCASSPGSKRHGNELLRHRLSTSEYERPHDGLSYSPSKRQVSEVNDQAELSRYSADAHQETWMSRGQSACAAGFSVLGGSLERQMANGYSPRKWW